MNYQLHAKREAAPIAATPFSFAHLPPIPGLERLVQATRGRPEISIAVLDGPVAFDRADGQPRDAATDHGTLVFSIIAGAPDAAVPGIAPGCTVFPITIFDVPPEGGRSVCSQERLAAAIDEALARGANIINISASEQGDLLGLAPELNAALQRAAARDVLVVAATGNQGCACDTIPACVPGVLAVGAHDGSGEPLLSSNWGPGQRNSGLLAPGDKVAGSCSGGGLCVGTGTSFAAATVSGIAGLLMSLDLDRQQQPSGARTARILLDSSERPPPESVEVASKYLSGRLNVSRAVDRLLGPFALSPAQAQEGAVRPASDDIVEAEMPMPPAAEGAPGLEAISGRPAIVPQAETIGLKQADCGCGGGSAGECTCGGPAQKAPDLVYAIGRLGVSFISLSRRDAIWRSIHGRDAGVATTPEIDLRPIDNASLRELLAREPWQAQSVVWTLSRTEVPMYAILPSGAFAERIYAWMVEQWADSEVEFVSLPGVVAGKITLYDGMTVEAVVPDLRGMYSWNKRRYLDALAQALPARPEGEGAAGQVGGSIDRFLSKIFYRIRNRGRSPEERALNAAATNAFNLSDVVVTAGQEGLAFKDVSVEKSPFNRPGSDYYDVLLTFFSPDRRLERAPLVARFTVDVSDTVPVVVGEPVQWFEY